MSAKTPDAKESVIHIAADLDQNEAELLCHLFRDYITENREIAKMKQLAGEIPEVELKWHLGHADYVDTIAKKLFPGWE